MLPPKHVSKHSHGKKVSTHDPQKEGIDSQEAAVVEDDAGPPDDGGEQRHARGDGGKDQLDVVPDPYDVRMLPDVEPRGEDEAKGRQRDHGVLQRVLRDGQYQ